MCAHRLYRIISVSKRVECIKRMYKESNNVYTLIPITDNSYHQKFNPSFNSFDFHAFVFVKKNDTDEQTKEEKDNFNDKIFSSILTLQLIFSVKIK